MKITIEQLKNLIKENLLLEDQKIVKKNLGLGEGYIDRTGDVGYIILNPGNNDQVVYGPNGLDAAIAVLKNKLERIGGDDSKVLQKGEMGDGDVTFGQVMAEIESFKNKKVTNGAGLDVKFEVSRPMYDAFEMIFYLSQVEKHKENKPTEKKKEKPKASKKRSGSEEGTAYGWWKFGTEMQRKKITSWATSPNKAKQFLKDIDSKKAYIDKDKPFDDSNRVKLTTKQRKFVEDIAAGKYSK